VIEKRVGQAGSHRHCSSHLSVELSSISVSVHQGW